jgi:hypothetical protein
MLAITGIQMYCVNIANLRWMLLGATPDTHSFTVGNEPECAIKSIPRITKSLPCDSYIRSQPRNRIILVSQHGVQARVCKRPFSAEKLFGR